MADNKIYLRMSLPAQWRALSANRRDILLSLCLDGPATTNELLDRIGGVEGKESRMTIYRNVTELTDQQLIEPTDEPGHKYELTQEGGRLVDTFRAAVS